MFDLFFGGRGGGGIYSPGLRGWEGGREVKKMILVGDHPSPLFFGERGKEKKGKGGGGGREKREDKMSAMAKEQT